MFTQQHRLKKAPSLCFCHEKSKCNETWISLWGFCKEALISWTKTSNLTMCLVTLSHTTFCNPMDCSPPGSSVRGDSAGKHTRVGSHALLQGIFPTQGSNPGLPHCRLSLYCLSHQGSLSFVWNAISYSKGSFWPRNQTWVSCIDRQILLTTEPPGKPHLTMPIFKSDGEV